MDEHPRDKTGLKYLCVGEGYNPYKCHTPREKLAQEWGCDFEEDAKSCIAGHMIQASGSSSTSGQIGVWAGGKMTVYMSSFFRAEASPDYTAKPK